MSAELLDRLDEWKSLFGSPATSPLEQLLATIATERFPDAEALIRLHETVLFLRAYPASRKAARLADAILFSFGKRVAGLQAAGADLEAFEAPEVSGIAGGGRGPGSLRGARGLRDRGHVARGGVR